MVLEKLSSKNFGVQFDYEKDIVEYIKTIPGANWNGDKKLWSIPLIFGMEFCRKCHIPPNLLNNDVLESFTKYLGIKNNRIESMAIDKLGNFYLAGAAWKDLDGIINILRNLKRK